MQVDYRKREKVNLSAIKYSQPFKMVDNDDFFIRVDLSKEVAFKEIVIKTNSAYCVNLNTGDLVIFDLNMIVHSFSAKVVEL